MKTMLPLKKEYAAVALKIEENDKFSTPCDGAQVSQKKDTGIEITMSPLHAMGPKSHK